MLRISALAMLEDLNLEFDFEIYKKPTEAELEVKPSSR